MGFFWGLFTIVLGFLDSSVANGLRPKDFVDPSGNKIVFVDFQEVHHKIVFDVAKSSAEFVTSIVFKSETEGAPVFDIVDDPTAVELDGQKADQMLVTSPDQATKFRVVTRKLRPGKHVLRVAGTITRNVSFGLGTVKSGFFMTDLSDRGYTERYLPTNLEYDQFATKMEVAVVGTQKRHTVFTNGAMLPVARRRANVFAIAYPEKFTTSSMFFHLGPEEAYDTKTGVFVSKTGRAVPIGVYRQAGATQDLERYLNVAVKELASLEEIYGPYLHSNVVIYAFGSGGMEYCGATVTSLAALSHELAHSWFARGVMPGHGNAGWLDEAITSWRDDGFKKVQTFSGNRPMADGGDYKRSTDSSAYGFGASFIGHLHSEVPNFFDFLRHMIKNRSWYPLTTEEFVNELSNFTGRDFRPLFQKHVYRSPSERARRIYRSTPRVPNPYHPELTAEQERRML